MDNARSSSPDDVVQAAKGSGVLMYSIGIGNPNSPAGVRIATGPFVIGGDDEEHVDAVTLSSFASANGSKGYIIQKVGNGAELKRACDEFRRTCTNGTRTRSVSSLTRPQTRVDDDTNPSPEDWQRQHVEAVSPAQSRLTQLIVRSSLACRPGRYVLT